MTTQTVSVESSANALEWAAEVLRGRLAEVLENREAALQTADIEGVHRMRVAIRRLRCALRDFSPWMKRRFLRDSEKDFKKLADALGAARDLDVEIAALERLRSKAKGEKIQKGIGKMIERRRARREAVQPALRDALEAAKLEDARGRFLAAVGAAGAAGGKGSEISAQAAGRKVISNGVREFCALSECLYDPFDRENHHELRIAAKHLRYAVELFTVFWGDRIAPFADDIARMQTFLGEVHDSDIWIENLSRRMRKSKDKPRRADLWLMSRFTSHRAKNYRAALALWGKWQKNDFFGKLRAVLKTDDQIEILEREAQKGTAFEKVLAAVRDVEPENADDKIE